MSALPAHTSRDDAAEQVRQHGGDKEGALIACLGEIDRLGLLLERAIYSNSYGYRCGRLRNPQTVAPAPVGKREIFDV